LKSTLEPSKNVHVDILPAPAWTGWDTSLVYFRLPHSTLTLEEMWQGTLAIVDD